MEIKSILVIADRKDDHTLIALKRAATLLENKKTSRIHLVAFVHEAFIESEKVLTSEEADKYKTQIIDRRMTDLKGALKQVELGKLEVDIEVIWQREIYKWIVSHSDKGQYELIIKTGNRTEALWYMPTDWKLMRECLTPTYIAARKSWKKKSAVLATVDFDSRSKAQQSLNRHVLTEAAAIAERLGAELHICHVIAVSQVLKDMDLVDTKRLKRSFTEKSAPRLLALAAEFGVDADRVHVRMGAPHREIPSQANKLKAELVVMGGFGRKGAKGAMLGNTAEQVISVLRTDILVVKHPA